MSGHARARRQFLAKIVILAIGAALLVHFLGAETKPSAPQIPTPSLEGADPDFRDAVLHHQKRLDAEPNSAANWGRYGMLLLVNGRVSESLACLSRAETLDPADARWPYYLSLAHLEQDATQAIEDLERAVARSATGLSEFLPVRLQLASLLIQNGRLDEADEQLRQVRAIDPEHVRGIYLTALLMAERGDLKGGTALLMLLNRNPTTRKKSLLKLATFHLRTGDQLAADKCQKAARAIPEDAEWDDQMDRDLRECLVGSQARMGRVSALMVAGKHREAVELLLKMIESGIESSDKVHQAYVLLGNNYVHLGRGADAIQAYEKAVRLVPEDADTHHRIALARMFEGEILLNRDRDTARKLFRAAIEHVKTSVKLNPQSADSQKTLGQLLFYLENYGEASQALNEALRVRPEMAEAHLLLGQVLDSLGQRDKAEEHLKVAVRFSAGDPKYQDALNSFNRKHGLPTQVPSR